MKSIHDEEQRWATLDKLLAAKLFYHEAPPESRLVGLFCLLVVCRYEGSSWHRVFEEWRRMSQKMGRPNGG